MEELIPEAKMDENEKKEKQWISLLHPKYLPTAFPEIHIKSTNEKCKNKMLPSKLEHKSVKVNCQRQV